MSDETPFMRQYKALKREAPVGSILLVKMGDFYEAFGEDAVRLSPIFGTLQTFGTAEEAQRRASAALDSAIAKLTADGYTLLCAPKTIDTDNHDWRRISRVRSPQGKRIALIAYAPWIDVAFDPWIY